MSRPRKLPTQQRSQATWDIILDGAARVFQAEGYAATTTNKVALRAGVSIGSLYQYFPNKEALLGALAERHIRQLGEALSVLIEALDRDRPGIEETVGRIIQCAVSLHEDDPELHRLLFDQSPRTPEALAALRQFEETVSAAVARHLASLGVGGETPLIRATLLVQGVEAQIHGAVLDVRGSAQRARVIADVERLWVAALRGSA